MTLRTWKMVGWAVVTVLGARGSAALADAVSQGGRTWNGAKIQQVQDGRLRFTDQNGAQQAVLLETVTRLQVDTRDEMNRAEDLRRQGDAPEAAKAYEAALRTENRNDLASILRWRLMDLYGRSGQLDRAVEMYVEVAKQPDFLMVVKDWRPGNVSSVRPKLREAAVATLDDALRQTRMGLASEYLRQVREYIVAGKDGATEPAASGGEASGEPVPAKAGSGGAAGDGATSGVVNGTLSAELIDQGEYGKALALANQRLAAESIVRKQLEEALFLRGAALCELAGKDRTRLLQAGWALARVLVEFPGSEYTWRCQYYLGLVHAGLGKMDVARQYLQLVARSAAPADLKQKAQKAYQDIVAKK